MLAPNIYQQLSKHLLLPQHLPSLRLGSVELLITEMIGTPGSSPWAGYTTWEELLEKAPASEVITLEFQSPTTFRRGDLDLPVPLPELVFASYLAKWQTFAPIPLCPTLSEKEFFTRHVGVKEHRIHTIPFHDGRVTIPGFVGQVTFLVKGPSEELVRQINALANFAFYAGTGRKTTHGMGMTRRIR
jgi:CRISPR-associated endoribonuclease Cas6